MPANISSLLHSVRGNNRGLYLSRNGIAERDFVQNHSAIHAISFCVLLDSFFYHIYNIRINKLIIIISFNPRTQRMGLGDIPYKISINFDFLFFV